MDERSRSRVLGQAVLGRFHVYGKTLQQMRGRVPDLMDQLGLSEEHLIDKHLRRHLTAKRTVFFQKDGKVKQKVTGHCPSGRKDEF